MYIYIYKCIYIYIYLFIYLFIYFESWSLQDCVVEFIVATILDTVYGLHGILHLRKHHLVNLYNKSSNFLFGLIHPLWQYKDAARPSVSNCVSIIEYL